MLCWSQGVYCSLTSFPPISSEATPACFVSIIGLRYTKPTLPVEKNTAHYIYKKNIAMTDCLVILYPACRQFVIAILFFLSMVCSVFCGLQSRLSISSALLCSQGLVYLQPNSVVKACLWLSWSLWVGLDGPLAGKDFNSWFTPQWLFHYASWGLQ